MVLVFKHAYSSSFVRPLRQDTNYHGRWSILFRNALHKCCVEWDSFIIRYPNFILSHHPSPFHRLVLPKLWNALLTPFNNAHHFEYTQNCRISIIINAVQSCVHCRHPPLIWRSQRRRGTRITNTDRWT